VEHDTIFICYAICTNEVELVQVRVEHGTIFCYATCADEVDSCSGTQGTTLNYHGNKAFQANNWSSNAWVKVIQPTRI